MAVFLISQQKTTQTWSLTSAVVRDGYTDLILSWQAMNCTVATLTFYRNTVGKLLVWIEQRGITSPEEFTARYIREYLAELAGRGLADTSVLNFARAIKTIRRALLKYRRTLKDPTGALLHSIYGGQIGMPELAAHDLRRTFAKLAHKGSAGLDQIELSLGHLSIKTTEEYLGVSQSLTDAPSDHLGLMLE